MSPVDKKFYRDGFSDDLVPLESIDVAARGSVDELLHAYSKTAFGGRLLGQGADTLEVMLRDPRCFVVMTVSGAMTVAKQGLLMAEMVERGWVHAIVATGALMAHGFVEGTGRSHFKYDPRMNDVDLLNRGYDRVYDTLELEQNLDDTEKIVNTVVESLPEDRVLCSEVLLYELGRYLDDNTGDDQRSVIKSAYKKKVPIFVPAFTDSEMGLDFAMNNARRMHEGQPKRAFDPFLDLDAYARLVSVQDRTGIFTIGGGVPRNWAQQAGPFLDLVEKRMGLPGRGFRFRYGLRVCPEPVHWGGLSGCTYREGVSWGKFVPEEEGGRFSEILADATIVWPLLVRGMIERLGDAPLEKNLVPRPPPEQSLFTLRG